MTVRLLFIGYRRLSDALISIHFDNFIDHPIDKTIVYHYDPTDLVVSHFKKYFDLSKFEFVQDSYFIEQIQKKYPAELSIIKNYPAWIRQQFYKFFALDFCDAEQIIISDCDSFRIKSHKCFIDGYPVLYLTYNENQLTADAWGNAFEKLTGIKQSRNVMVSEFMPILKTDWVSFKQRVQYYSSVNWCKSLINSIQTEYGLTLSEYQILGNWMLHLRPNTSLVNQYRLGLGMTDWGILHELNCNIDQFNCINLNTFGPSDWDQRTENTTFIPLTDVEIYVKLINDRLGSLQQF